MRTAGTRTADLHARALPRLGHPAGQLQQHLGLAALAALAQLRRAPARRGRLLHRLRPRPSKVAGLPDLGHYSLLSFSKTLSASNSHRAM